MNADWGKYSPAELEAQYNNRAAVPEYVDIFARWRRGSDRTRAEMTNQLELQYGTDPRQRLDLFLPDVSKAPLHLFVHGGYWQSLSKSYFSLLAPALLRRGIAFAALGYRLCPTVTLGDIVEDVRQGCLALRRHATRLGVDRDRIQVSGHSAGGHLVAMLLATRWRDYGRKLPPTLFHSALSLSGVFELEPLLGLSQNAALRLDRVTARALSPVLLEPLNQVPLLLAVGGDESAEFHRQSGLIETVWGDAGLTVDHLNLPGRNHFTIVDDMAEGGILLDLAENLLQAG